MNGIVQSNIDWTVFDRIDWGNPESTSGPGSTLATTATLRKQLGKTFRDLGIRTLVDAPCGDMNWMRHVEYRFEKFIGVDIASKLITRLKTANLTGYHFQVGNIATDILPSADAVFCRDCLVHFPFAAIDEVFRLWKLAGFKYVFMTTFPGVLLNENCKIAGWRMLNMQAPPFNLPTPRLLLLDNDRLNPPFDSKSVGVWEMHDLF